MNRVVGSFGWPFRGRWQPVWALGVLALILLPLGVLPLLGYAVAAVREPGEEGPPRWRLTARLLLDGAAVLCAIAVIAVPFVLGGILLAHALDNQDLWRSNGSLVAAEAGIAAALIVALPWGLVMLALMPHAVARYADSGSIGDLFAYRASVRGVRADFALWNVTAAAIVTGWALAAAGLALCCVGAVPGTFYAILVSAHATAALRPAGARPPTR